MAKFSSVYAPAAGAEAAKASITVSGAKGAPQGQDPGDLGAFQVIGKRSAPLPNRARDPHLETVLGEDDRILVNETTKFPWRAIAQLEITPRPGKDGPLIGGMVRFAQDAHHRRALRL